MSQLTKYVIALSHLYGMVHKDKVVEIYNSQNEDQVSLADVEAILNNPPEKLEDAFVMTRKDYFVMETIIDNSEFDLMLRKKADKPYYVPARDELLKYVDESYFEKSKKYNDLLSYLQKNFFKPGDEKAEWLAEDIQGMCQFGVNMQTIFDSFNKMKISFKDMNQTNEVMQLVMELSNNIRIWENNGYTPNEIFEKFEKPNLRPLPNKPFEFRSTAKVGRNDPCPCGSGKKYKKCCLGKEDI
jgi:preprotein translocase subunit SecA